MMSINGIVMELGRPFIVTLFVDSKYVEILL